MSIAAIVAYLLALILLGTANRVMAQSAPPLTLDSFNVPAVNSSHALEVFRLLQQQVISRQIELDQPLQPIYVRHLMGVKVTLRRVGFLVGSGEVTHDQFDTNEHGITDLAAAVTQTLKLAMRSSNQMLQRRHAKAVAEAKAAHRPPPQPRTLEQLGPWLQMDLQLAHSFERIELADDKGFELIYQQFAPGFHGLCLRTPQGSSGDAPPREAWLWPADALATNSSPRNQLIRLPALLKLPITSLNSIGQANGPTLHRFNVIHIARHKNEAPAIHLVRGNKLLELMSIDGITLAAAADRLTNFLIRRQRKTGQMAGAHLPSSGRDLATAASLQEAALVAYALARRARYLNDLNPEASQVVQRATTRTCRYLTDSLPPQQLARHPVASALVMMALIEAPHLVDQKAKRDVLAQSLLAIQSDDGLFRKPAIEPVIDDDKKASDADATLCNLPTQAILYAALTSLYQQTRQVDIGQSAIKLQAAIWTIFDPQLRVSSPYWLMLAESRMRRLINDDDLSVAAWPVRAQAMYQMAQSLLAVQITMTPPLGPSDVVGGFDLTAPDPINKSLLPNPDWRSAQVLAFLAITLGEPGMIENSDQRSWILRCGLAARFVVQLMFDEPGCFYVRSHDDALGGLKRTLWDNTLAVGPNAMALLAATELQQTLANLLPP